MLEFDEDTESCGMRDLNLGLQTITMSQTGILEPLPQDVLGERLVELSAETFTLGAVHAASAPSLLLSS